MTKNDASNNKHLIGAELGQRFFAAAVHHLSLLGQQLIRYDCLTSAAALTYTTLFAVVPLMTVTLLFFSLLPEFAVLGQDFQNFLFQNFLPAGSTLVQEKLLEFADRATGLTAAGVIGLLITSLLMLVAVEKQFNNIWQVEAPQWSLHRVLVYWGILSLGPVAIVSGMLVSAYLVSIPLISDLEAWTVGKTLLTYLPVLLTALGFTRCMCWSPIVRCPSCTAFTVVWLQQLFLRSHSLFTLKRRKTFFMMLFTALLPPYPYS